MLITFTCDQKKMQLPVLQNAGLIRFSEEIQDPIDFLAVGIPKIHAPVRTPGAVVPEDESVPGLHKPVEVVDSLAQGKGLFPEGSPGPAAIGRLIKRLTSGEKGMRMFA